MSKAIIMECIYNIVDTNKVKITHFKDSVQFVGDILVVSSVKILAENIGLNVSGYIQHDEKKNTTTIQITF